MAPEIDPARERVIAELADLLGLSADAELLDLALTHRSFAFESGGLPTNERLEFLGDAVLGLVVTDELYRRHPERAEGELARMRASVVNARSLAELAATIGVGGAILLGKGEEATGGRGKSSILADTMEALLGAVYLTVGFADTRRRILQLFSPLIERAGQLGAGLDWKTSLQELASKRDLGVPRYVVTATGPDHARSFSAAIELSGRIWGRGEGSAKRHAEQQAAQAAWQAITEGSGPEPAADPESVEQTG
ncbi:MAG: ribonuclease III [Actinobacteria bacterium]|nr:ribonuclease III [Actinomycetota bacterium]